MTNNIRAASVLNQYYRLRDHVPVKEKTKALLRFQKQEHQAKILKRTLEENKFDMGVGLIITFRVNIKFLVESAQQVGIRIELKTVAKSLSTANLKQHL